MSAPAANAAAAGGAWLAWACFGLLTLPFHPLWIDFEQVRRGVLLVFAGAALVFAPALRPARGGRALLWLVAALTASSVVQVLAQWWFRAPDAVWSFAPWDAAYRLALWLALWVVLRLGASAPPEAAAKPLAVLLLATSLFGLLQRLGVADVLGYGVEREPVSTFGNLNVASEWTAVAATAVAALWPARGARWRLPATAMVLAGAYLVVDRSRSGMVALPIGLALVFALRRGARGGAPLLLAAAGAALGLVLDAAASRPGPADTRAQHAELKRGTVTLEVRREIAVGATGLFLAAPVFGHGPGQFAVQYPRVRSQQEIDLSSFDRAFATEVRTAHDDWLEMLVDGGVPALLLFTAFLFALQRGARDRPRLLPMLVLLLLMLVRSPLGNAPAAAVAFWLAGQPVDAPPPPPWRRLGSRVLGVLLIALGALPVVGNTLFVPYLDAQRRGEQPPVGAVTAAAACMPFEPRWFELQARENLLAGNLQRAAHLAARACALRPFAPQYLLLLAEVLARSARYGEALAVAQQALALDPANPELRVLASTAYAELGDVDRAIEAVVVDPHPALRAQLENHFADLALRADQRSEPDQAARYAVEHAFLAAIDRLGSDDVATNELVRDTWQQLGQALRACGRLRTDLRWLVVGALQALDLGKPELAATFGEQALALDAKLTGWQTALLGPRLDRLRALPAWQPVLSRR